MIHLIRRLRTRIRLASLIAWVTAICGGIALLLVIATAYTECVQEPAPDGKGVDPNAADPFAIANDGGLSFVNQRPRQLALIEDAAAADAQQRPSRVRATTSDGGAKDGGAAPVDPDIARCEELAMAPIDAMLGSSSERVDGGASSPHSSALLRTAKILRDRPRNTTQFLIATLPDPWLSGMFYSADRAIEAVQRGIEISSGTGDGPRWLRDRYWSPWHEDPDADESTKRELLKCRQIGMPLVLTFRDDVRFGLPLVEDQPQVFILFIAGESPIWGINRPAIHEALDFVALAAKNVRDIGILGPTYSGSAPSLYTELSTWQLPTIIDDGDGGVARQTSPVPCFSIVSGTTTREAIKERLDTCTGGESNKLSSIFCSETCRPGKAPESGPQMEFHASTIPDTKRLKAFYGYLVSDLGVAKRTDDDGKCLLEHVALLKETSTAYSLLPRSADGGVAETQAPIDAGSTKTKYAPSEPNELECEPELVIAFPPHISNVRRAYDEKRAEANGDDAKKKATGGASSPNANALMPSTVQEPRPEHDVIPNLSPRTTYSNDLLLENIINALVHRNIHYVGLFATDRSDIIFLATHLHENASDMRAFTFASELLYAHPAYAESLSGMLVGSTYPLIIEPNERDPRTIDLFSGEQEQGIYNATVALLGKFERMNGYVHPPPRIGDPPNLVRRPPVWISVIGRRGTFPIKAIAADGDPKDFMVPSGVSPLARTPATEGKDAQDKSSKHRNEERRKDLPHVWRIVYAIMSVFIVYIAAVHFWSTAVYSYQIFWNRIVSWWQRRKAKKGHAPLKAVKRNLNVVPSFPPFMSLFYPCVNLRADLRKEAATVFLFSFILAAYSPIHVLDMSLGGSGFWGLNVGLFVNWMLGVSLVVAVLRLVYTVWVSGWREVNTWSGLADIGVAFLSWLSAGVATGLALHVGAHVANAPLATGLPGNAVTAFCRRAVALGSGVSPITPLVFAMIIVVLWASGTIDRLRMVDGVSTPNTLDDKSELPPISKVLTITGRGVPKDIRILETLLQKTAMVPMRAFSLRLALVPVALLPMWAFKYMKPLTTLEVHATGASPIFSELTANSIAAFTIVACAILVVDTLLSIAFLYYRLQSLLRRLARHPLNDSGAYGRLNPAIGRSLQQQLSGSVPNINELAIPVMQLRMLRNADPNDEKLEQTTIDAVKAFAHERDELAQTHGYIVLGASDTMEALMRAAALFMPNLRKHWDSQLPKVEKKEEEKNKDAKEKKESKPAASGLTETVLEQRESFVAALVTIFIHQYVRLFRPMMTTAVGGSVLLLLLLASYVFEPRHLIMSFMWVLILGCAVVVGYVFVQLDKDELLSRIAKSVPGSVTVNRDLVLRIITWAALPILSLLAVQYPAITDAIGDWVTPLFKGLQH